MGSHQVINLSTNQHETTSGRSIEGRYTIHVFKHFLIIELFFERERALFDAMKDGRRTTLTEPCETEISPASVFTFPRTLQGVLLQGSQTMNALVRHQKRSPVVSIFSRTFIDQTAKSNNTGLGLRVSLLSTMSEGDADGVAIHPTISSIRSMRKSLEPAMRVGFVPTMGALHEGAFPRVDT